MRFMKHYCLAALFLIFMSASTSLAASIELRLEDHGFIGKYQCPGNLTSPRLDILVLGGSEGGIPRGEGFRKAGFPVLSVAYFGIGELPPALNLIPLEYFDKPIDWLLAQKETMPGGIAVIGGSKGAELALLLASREPRIQGVIAFSPSSVVFQGIPNPRVWGSWEPMSSWSACGRPMPYVPYDTSQGFDINNLRSFYNLAMKQEEHMRRAAIEVERINGPILLFSGRQDSLWDASAMGDMIIKRLQEKQFQHEFEHHAYPEAGHTMSEHRIMGGTAEGNKAARIDLEARVKQFLAALNDRLTSAAGSLTEGDGNEHFTR